MLRIGICDDESRARDALRHALESLLRNLDGQIYYEFSSGEGVVQWASKHRGEIDLLFLDVELKGISGIEAAQLIRQQDSGLMIVFVTGYADFVFDGYAVQAMDYLIKPVKEEKLGQVLIRARELLVSRQPQMFAVHNSDGIYRIAKRDILYFYSDRRLVKLVTEYREYAFYGKLDEVEKQLETGFVRIHQRYLIRAEAVRKVEKSTVTVGHACLPISRALRQTAVMTLARALLGEDDRG